MRLLHLVSTALLSGCSVFGIRTVAEPAHTVVAQVGPVQVRQYGPRIVAETTVEAVTLAARSIGFQRLAGYIFGGNHGGRAIDMTAPVAQQGGRQIDMTAPVAQAPGSTGGGSVIRFYMPREFTLQTLPQPNDPAVRLVQVPAETVAVLRFSGSTAPEAVAAETSRLMQTLQGSPWHPVGEPFAWFYDPPWTLPPLRRNEVGVAVSKP